MKNLKLAFTFLFVTTAAFAQQFRLAEASEHYKTLQQFSGAPNPSRKWLDTLTFPASEYGNSIVYLLVKPHYLTEKQVKSLTESVSFPANSSDQTRKELDYLLELQSRRTEEQRKRVEYLGNVGYWPSINQVPSHAAYEQNLKDLFFEAHELLGEDVNARSFPKISALLQGAMQDMRIMEFTIKYRKLRARPYHLEPSLQAMAKMGSPSFASGHTLWAFLQAFIWSEIIPEKQQEFIALAEEIRRSREIMGIHFPSDNEAARQVAFNMIQHYFKNETFRKDLDAAVAEWKSKGSSVLTR